MDTKKLTLPLRISLMILVLGTLFKVMHWPYGQALISLSSALIMVLYGFRFYFKKDKTMLDYLKLAMVLLWTLSNLIKSFHLFTIPYVFEILILVLIIWWLIAEGFALLFNRRLKKNKGIKISYYVWLFTTISLIAFGVVFKIQHWPFSNIMFTFGMLFLCVFLLLDYFAIERKH